MGHVHSSISELSLTAGDAAERALQIDLREHPTPFAFVPEDCNSLTVDEQLAPFVGDYTNHRRLHHQATKLQHLGIKYGTSSTCQCGSDPIAELPDLSHMTQLTSLKVAPDRCLNALFDSLAKCPESLTSCYIRGWSHNGMEICFRPELCQPVQEHLRRLTKLELSMCSVIVPTGCITCLEGLTSLSITQSELEPEFDEVRKLTNLVSLDLTDTNPPGAIYGEVTSGEPWSKFDAWPALQVFKFAACWLIDTSTALNIATVNEVHTDMLTPGMESANIHWVLQHTFTCKDTLGVLASLTPVWCSCIVGLHVNVPLRPHMYTALQLATAVNQVLDVCLCLQTFRFDGGAPENGGQAKILLGSDYSGQLKDLTLKHICCNKIDLGLATTLTSISLTDMDSRRMSCELVLPSMVERLEFLGNALITRDSKYLLQGLSCLRQVTLGHQDPRHFSGTEELGLSSSACMPTLPGSLRHLRVMTSAVKGLLDHSAQRCLKFCTSLEHLTLPAYEHPMRELHAWVKAARHVHILDNEQNWPYNC